MPSIIEEQTAVVALHLNRPTPARWPARNFFSRASSRAACAMLAFAALGGRQRLRIASPRAGIPCTGWSPTCPQQLLDLFLLRKAY